MSKPTDISLREVTSGTEHIDFRVPIKFGGRVVTDVVLLNVTVEVETRDGRRGRGFGSMPMGNVWAWPSQQVSGRQDPGGHDRPGPAACQRSQSLRGQRPSAGDYARSVPVLRAGGRRDHARGRPGRADAAAGPTRGGQPAGSRHPRRLRQGAGPELVQPAGAGVRRPRSGRLSDRGVRRRVSRSVHAAQPKPHDAAVSSDRRPGSLDRRRHLHAGSTTACRKRCPSGSPSTG